MKQQYQILLVEDHLITLDAYKSVLELMPEEFIITEAQNIDTALEKMQKQPALLPFDIAFVDIHLPKSITTIIESGEELALELKKKFSNIKIIIPTQYNQAERIKHIVNMVAPDALLLKEEFRSIQISQAVHAVLNNEHYYSPKVVTLLRKEDLEFDVYDLKILSCLARGVKIKDMPLYIPLSLRAIEDRKSMLMFKLEVPARNNEKLIAVAREKGLI
jgi:DNA-binding NarL/FixJ family response regulator